MWMQGRQRSRLSHWLLLIILLGISGCASQSTLTTRPPTATTLPTATPTATPLPTATSLPTAGTATTAGWQAITDPHWSGYNFPQGNLTGIRAEWREPQVAYLSGGEEFTWIGIGGWNDDNLIQVGTFAYFPPRGGTHQGMWYESIPPNKALYPLIDVSPGDLIFASIVMTQSSPQSWRMQVIDETTQATFDQTIPYNSVQTYADFIVEDPNETANSGPPYYPMPSFSPVTFSNMQVRIGSSWSAANAYYGYQITMYQNGQTLSTPGGLNGASFTVKHG